MLIVLDNAFNSDQISSLLPSCPTCTVLITSRSSLMGLVTTDEAHPVAAQLGQHDDARRSCERAFGLFSQENNRQGQAVTLDHLGYIALHSLDYDEALRCLNASLALCRDLGATYYEADTLEHLGRAHAALRQLSEARHAWQQALQLHRAQTRTVDTLRIEQLLAELS